MLQDSLDEEQDLIFIPLTFFGSVSFLVINQVSKTGSA